jgi:hypothetical protein
VLENRRVAVKKGKGEFRAVTTKGLISEIFLSVPSCLTHL